MFIISKHKLYSILTEIASI